MKVVPTVDEDDSVSRAPTNHLPFASDHPDLTTQDAVSPEQTTEQIDQDIAEAESRTSAFRQKIAAQREQLRERPALYIAYRIAVTAVGGAIAIGGIAMLFTPGPGWVAIFLGLGILATEFAWAHRLNGWVKDKARLLISKTKALFTSHRAKKETDGADHSDQ